jgi:hypothetical protein
MKPSLAPLLNAEILALATRENKTDEKLMNALMTELGQLCGVSRRMVYHWRSGHHPLPGEHVPVLCERFSSRVLLDALTAAAGETAVEVPDNFDLAILASRSVREDMAFIEQILLDFESDGIQPGEMATLRELEARAHQNLHQLMGIAAEDCARRLEAHIPARKGEVRATGERRRKADEGSLVKARK